MNEQSKCSHRELNDSTMAARSNKEISRFNRSELPNRQCRDLESVDNRDSYFSTSLKKQTFVYPVPVTSCQIRKATARECSSLLVSCLALRWPKYLRAWNRLTFVYLSSFWGGSLKSKRCHVLRKIIPWRHSAGSFPEQRLVIEPSGKKDDPSKKITITQLVDNKTTLLHFFTYTVLADLAPRVAESNRGEPGTKQINIH